MKNNKESPRDDAEKPLHGLSILEVSSERTMFAGQLLADFGAHVVALEPPGGAPGRRVPPFAEGRPGLDRSLVWMSVNRGKQSLTLDTNTPDGKAIIEEIAASFDAVIYESIEPVAMTFNQANLRDTIRCELYPFDPVGPKKNYVPSELVFAAASGSASLSGQSIGRPLFFPSPQSLFEIGAEVAVVLMAALSNPTRQSIGRIEIVERGAVLAAAFSQPLLLGAAGAAAPPEPAQEASGLPNIFQAADGYVQLTLVFGTAFDPRMTGLAHWLVDVGAAEPDLPTTDWMMLSGRTIQDPTVAAIVDAVTGVVKNSTREEVAVAAGSYGFFASPVYDMTDVLQSERLRRRGAFVTVEHPLGEGELEIPLSFARASGYDAVSLARPPLLGADTIDLLRERTTLSHVELAALFAQGVI